VGKVVEVMAKRNEAKDLNSKPENTERAGVAVLAETLGNIPQAEAREMEPTEADLAEVASELATLPDDELAGGSLSRYFRDMSVYPVMDPAEEVKAAEEFLSVEIARWQRAFSYPPAFPVVRRVVEHSLARLAEPVDLPELDKLETSLKGFRKNRSKFDRKHQDHWDTVVIELSQKLRALDADRLFIEAVDDELARVAGNADETSEEANSNESGTVLSPGFKRYLNAVAQARDAVYRIKNRFVAANLRLVVSIARRYNRGRMPLIDII